MNGDKTLRPRSTGEPDAAMVDLVGRAMAESFWLPPIDDEGVAQAEAAEPVALHESLADPAAVFDRRESSGGADAIRLADEGDVSTPLARAAREGGRITPDVEQAMRADRDAAERERNHGDLPETDIS